MERILYFICIFVICATNVCAQPSEEVVTKRAGENYEFIGNDNNNSGLRLVKLRGKCGFINSQNEEVIPLKYDDAYPFENKNRPTGVKLNGKWGLINTNGELIVPFKYSAVHQSWHGVDFLKVTLNHKMGYIDPTGKESIPLIYDCLPCSGVFYNGYPAVAKINNKYGYIDSKNNVVIPFHYDFAYDFHEGLAAVELNGKFGFINMDGNEKIPFIYDDAYIFCDGLCRIGKRIKKGVIDSMGKTTMLYGLIDKEGKQVVPCEYGFISIFFSNGCATVEKNGKYGLINKKGKLLTPLKFHNIKYGEIGILQDKEVYLDSRGNEYETKKMRDDNEINTLIETANEDPYVAFGLGKLYYYGNTVPKDRQEAFKWIQLAANNGVEEAYDFLGLMYYWGQGVEKNLREAFSFFMLSANHNVDSQYYLGWMYEHGQGVDKNIAEAMKWYEKSASLGYRQSKDQLAIIKGKDNPQPVYDLSKPTFEWLASNGGGNSAVFTFKIGVKSKSKIEELNVYINGTLNRGVHSVTNDGNDMTISRSITLRPGNNVIKITARNTAGMATTEKQIEYKVVDVKKIEKRIALVMGNANYFHTTVLRNSVNDATDIADKLESLGFTVIRAMNKTHKQMDEAIHKFGRLVENYEVALFYYSGHAMQFDGFNYLVPIEADLKIQSDAQYHCVNTKQVLDNMERAKLKIVILDACRNNPLPKTARGYASANGLHQMDTPNGTFVAFSTSPGAIAQDGTVTDRNSPFTSALLNALDKPGLTIDALFKQVGKRVSEVTHDAQRPWISSGIYDDFFFNLK